MSKIKTKVIDFFGTIAIKMMMYFSDFCEMVLTAGITVVVCLIITNFFFMPVRVIGTSMYPTLSDGSLGFSSIISRRIEGIQRFDIVVLKVEEKKENLVKRVIGLPNETLWYQNDCLYIDGTPMTEDFFDQEYVKEQLSSTFVELFTGDTNTITLGEGEYFVLGDNRLVSSDSRYYGAFKEEMIISKGIFIFYPFNLFGSK